MPLPVTPEIDPSCPLCTHIEADHLLNLCPDQSRFMNSRALGMMLADINRHVINSQPNTNKSG